MASNTGCLVDILVDHSEPALIRGNFRKGSVESEEKENIETFAVADSIEIPRSEVLPGKATLEVEDMVLNDSVKVVPTHSNESILLIENEVFDFDLPISPDSSDKDREPKALAEEGLEAEEEVFFGPVGFMEKCIASGVAEEAIKPLTPLRPDQMAEVAKEAHSIACRIAKLKACENSPAPTSALVREVPACLLPSTSRKRTGTFTLDSPGKLAPSPEKERRRQGTFTKEEPVESLLAKAQEKKREAAASARPGAQKGSKLQAPVSRLRRYNNSQPNLINPKAGSHPEAKSPESTEAKKGSSIARKSLQLPRSGGVVEKRITGKEELTGVDLPDAAKTLPTDPANQTRIKRVQSFKSGLPSAKGSKLALLYQKASALPGAQKAKVAEVAAAKSGAPRPSSLKGPATKPLLMQPGQLQRRSLAVGRGRGAGLGLNGPLKPPPPPAAKMGNTVERPFNPALAAAAAENYNSSSQCPNTPAGHAKAQPKVLSLSSEGSTPAKSGSASSAVGSTPGSVNKRVSMLPTPSKRRSIAGSLPPPSPLSINSSRSRASSSEAGDSPVFTSAKENRILPTRRTTSLKDSVSDVDVPEASPFAFKPRKPLVQNTPDLPPKKTPSKWSPVRKSKPVLLDEQVSMCTKRVTPT